MIAARIQRFDKIRVVLTAVVGDEDNVCEFFCCHADDRIVERRFRFGGCDVLIAVGICFKMIQITDGQNTAVVTAGDDDIGRAECFGRVLFYKSRISHDIHIAYFDHAFGVFFHFLRHKCSLLAVGVDGDIGASFRQERDRYFFVDCFCNIHGLFCQRKGLIGGHVSSQSGKFVCQRSCNQVDEDKADQH